MVEIPESGDRMKVPEGVIIRTIKGGTDTLKRILTDLRKYSFTGYVKTILEGEHASATGYLVLREGIAALSYYEFIKDGSEKSYVGSRSLKFIWEDSYSPACRIELHTRIDMDEMYEIFPENSQLHSRMKGKSHKKPKPAAFIWAEGEKEEEEEEETDPLWQEIQEWKEKGYNVQRLEELYKKDRKAAENQAAECRNKIRKLRALEGLLDEMDTTGFEREVISIKKKLREPDMVLAVEAELEDLRIAIEKGVRADEQSEIWEKKKEKDREEKAEQVYDLILHGGKKDADPKEKEKENGLNPDLSFENFVVGASNRFAHGAAIAVAKNPFRAYNPLFITSGAGLGKTHLLNAIGNAIRKEHPDFRILYMTTEEFTNQLIQALESNRLVEFRDRCRQLDVLILDDVQFMAGKERTQEELFHTFNALYNDDKQIVLASDRPPKEIPTLSDRLISRFEAGLIVEINPPDVETRLAILQKKVKENGIEMGPQVITYIAENVRENIRELEGALNRIAAFSALMKRDINMELAREVLGKEEVSSVPEKKESGAKKGKEYELFPGSSYILEESRPVLCHVMFESYLNKGYSGLNITRTNPGKLRRKYNMADARLVWLTDRESIKEETVEPGLEMVMYLIEDMLEKNDRAIIVLDDIQYLISNNSFDAVAQFIRRLVDEISESDSILLTSVSPDTLSKQELSILERELELLEED